MCYSNVNITLGYVDYADYEVHYLSRDDHYTICNYIQI